LGNYRYSAEFRTDAVAHNKVLRTYADYLRGRSSRSPARPWNSKPSSLTWPSPREVLLSLELARAGMQEAGHPYLGPGHAFACTGARLILLSAASNRNDAATRLAIPNAPAASASTPRAETGRTPSHDERRPRR
jgi:hypothetical protein